MNWDAIAAIGQMLGSVAVLVTLGYLAVQVRHSRQEGRRALSQGRSEGVRETLSWQTDERINRLTVKAEAALGAPPGGPVLALMEQAGLTREEAIPLFMVQYAVWTSRAQTIPNVDELSAIERTQFETSIRMSYGRPGIARLFWEHFKQGTHPDAVRYIENLLAQPG